LILVDTDGLYRALDASDPKHYDVREVLESTDEPLVMSPFVLTELDYFIRKRLGRTVQLDLLSEVEDGAYELQLFDSNDVAEARLIINQYSALGISLADASIVVLARKLRTRTVLTFDNHFRTLQPNGASSFFVLLPEDA
jgi:predicted nucleic acid-binding protein